ncbi:hypothetical protein F443_22836, partial [Phytophthora nicotianae P1569]
GAADFPIVSSIPADTTPPPASDLDKFSRFYIQSPEF